MALVGTAVVFLLVGALLVIGAVGLLVLAAAIFSGSPRRLRETFECPVTGKVVTAEFLVPEGAKHPAGSVRWAASLRPGWNPSSTCWWGRARAWWGLSRAV